MKKTSEKSGYVYLLGDTSCEGVFKIGVTTGKIENRIKKLQTGNSGEIYLINYYEAEHPFFVEGWMHRKYCGKNVKNEWFEMDISNMVDFKKDCEEFDKLYQFSKIQKNFDV